MDRPLLVPGVRVVPRGRDRLQVGLEHPLLLPRTPTAEAALEALTTGDPPATDPETRAVLDRLAGAGLLLATDPRDDDDLAPGDLSALALAHPGSLPLRRQRRRTARVEVRGTLGVDPWPLLEAAGLRRRPVVPGLVLVLAVGEPDRAELDVLVRQRVPHLLVRLVDGIATIGPYVVPGRTACLRCLDAHRCEDDPGHPVLVDRYAAAGRRPRRDGLAEPVDTALATLAVAWAVREVVSAVDGDRPGTWSATVQCGPDLSVVRAIAWLRHPDCGCAWSDFLVGEGAPSGTLGG